MNVRILAALCVPALLAATPASPARQAEAWVREARKMAQSQGVAALVAEINRPKGRFVTEAPETDPELTVYSRDLQVLAQNRVTRHVGMNHTKLLDAGGDSYLRKMFEFSEKAGAGWYEYVGSDMNGRPKPYRAFVAFHDDHLIAAVVPR